ncbi:MAG: T9SS type A sorting domain-containing protein [Muribaculaceae bacterium]|nr:T9SS type A sorting domain-containing protein [Muribaculaceae bacterium]
MKFIEYTRSIIIALAVALSIGGGISAFALSPASVSQSVSPQPSVKVFPGRIEISVPGEEARQVVVYSLTGQVVKSFTAQPGVTSIDLSAGYYIVKCERTSTRVVVK